MKLRSVVLVTCLIIAGCTEKVTNRYPTRLAAEADSLFKRGWLPEVIPTSSRNIVVSNDLDTNSSEGEFDFEPAEVESFLAKLSAYSNENPALIPLREIVERRRKAGYVVYTYGEGDSIWIFFIHPQRGHAQYIMKASGILPH